MNIDIENDQIVYDSYNEFFFDAVSTRELFTRLYASQTDYIFRGESTNRYKLIPSVLRADNTKRRLFHTVIENNPASIPITQDDLLGGSEYFQILGEYMLLSNFYVKANDQGLRLPECIQLQNIYNDEIHRDWFAETNFVWYTNEIAQLASLAQHYGLATRMLDWSQDLLTSVYFAAHGACKKMLEQRFDNNEYMVIWLLNRKMICTMQLSKNPYPLKFVVPQYYTNPNLRAQKGILTYWELKHDHDVLSQLKMPVDRTPVDEKIAKYRRYEFKEFPLIYKLMIPVADCIVALCHITTLGYCSARLFPGYEGVIQQIDDETMINTLTYKPTIK